LALRVDTGEAHSKSGIVAALAQGRLCDGALREDFHRIDLAFFSTAQIADAWALMLNRVVVVRPTNGLGRP
jgi:hypothetical protein